MTKSGNDAMRSERNANVSSTYQQHLKLDARGDGMYSGTFRWLESKEFPALPSSSSQVAQQPPTVQRLAALLAKGWEGYLKARSDAAIDLVAVASTDPSCLDALSFPITFVHVAQHLSLCSEEDEEKHILIIGASSKAEQRIWRITDYWSEIAHFFPSTNVKLWFIGPEAQEDCPVKPHTLSNLSANHFCGTFGTFQDSHTYQGCTPENTIIIGYNTGFGNFVDSNDHRLLFSWLPDLYKIADSKIPAIFTCANDYADTNGEFAVQSRIIGAKMLLLPRQNPFSCASHLHEEGQRDTAWSRGNSFIYAIQGVDSSRRVQLTPGDVVTLQKRLDAELELHLQDALGRHFFRGMVLSKDQASRCKAITGAASNKVDAAAHAKATATTKTLSPRSSEHSDISALEKPRFQLLQGRSSREIVAVVHIPKVLAPSESIAVDLSDATLSVFILGKYLLQEKLPFDVPTDSVVRAELLLPVLRITFERTI
uniref:Mitochondrial splicing suppressor 51-like C-terminal domain-containing protein n=1 Tax=Globisporangium ultimum (strain ATCC 200006 / CBS 805.95 / DAOM BR144) TaxID=431595 RepID=K3X637_GLOUD